MTPRWSRALERLRAACALRQAEPVPDDARVADAANLHEVERRLRDFDRAPWQAQGLPTPFQRPADAFDPSG